MGNCKTCNKKISAQNKTGYCKPCLTLAMREEKLKLWLETGDTGMGVDTTIRGVIRDYILQQQNHQCAIYGMIDIWNGNILNFVLDHINGDASNSQPSNIRLICSNCDSQLATYKSRNKNSARNSRKVFLHETSIHVK